MISTWIWSRLPGPVLVKLLIVLLVVLAVVALLFEVVFPWVASVVPLQDPTLQEAP